MTMNPENRKRVVVVDDHEIVRSGLIDLINAEADLEVCGEAGDALAAMKVVRQERPDVALIDITLADGSGIELIKQIVASGENVRIVVCTMHDAKLYAERALQAGAMGYVNKQEPVSRVVDSIRRVLSGKIAVDEQVADRVLRRVAGREHDSPRSAIETLSDRELEVLELIGRGLTTRQIAESLNLSVKTIDTYREHLKSKLGLDSANELVRFAVAWTLGKEGS